MSTIRDDARIDPRIRHVFGAFPAPVNPGDAASREQLVEEANSEEAAGMRQRWDAFLERCDTEGIAPSAGLAITTRKLASEPDGNMINIRFIRPAGDEPMPCVYYIHGGGNLTLATGLKLLRDGNIGLVQGLYALCPYIAGRWPLAKHPSSTVNNGILLELHNNRGAMAYGIEELDAGNPLAWPGFAAVEDVTGLPATVISVNECDPLRDEGIEFYRLLLAAGVPAQCRQVMGTIHATEIFPIAAPEVSRETARSIADFCRGTTRLG